MDLTEQQIDVWSADLRVPDADLARLSALLSDHERARAGRLAADHARRAVAGKAALRIVLGRYLGISPAEVAYDFGLYGKPRTARWFASDLRFNLTDSHDLALIAVTRGRE